jgi:RNA polymerase sigma factor (sigma-70 family)
MNADEALLDAWQRGDRKAGHELFERHFESVRRFFVNKVGRELEDLVQRTFLGCLEGRERFAGRSSFRGFLFGVATNVLREHYRAQLRDARNDRLEDMSVADMNPGPSTALARKREQRLILEALRRIPLDAQIILELYYWEHLTGPQLAEVFGIPENTARSRLRRAKELLGKAIARLAKSRTLLESTTTNLDRWAASLRARVAALPATEPEV